MIYRLSLSTPENGHEGYKFFSSRSAAKKARRKLIREGDYNETWLLLACAKTPKTKAQMMALLERWADHANNG